jgi:Uncharacterized protein conserved in bacteria
MNCVFNTIETLYEMQKKLDERIIREKGLEGQDLLPNTVLALQVEIGELANEWRGFKHWSNDREPRIAVEYECGNCDGSGMMVSESDCGVCNGKGYIVKNRLLEEYVDCLHFFLSIARQLGVPAEKLKNTDSPVIEKEIVNAFSGLMVSVGMIRVYEPAFYHSWNEFIALGECLGFTWDEIDAAYMDKNRVNHERQKNGY